MTQRFETAQLTALRRAYMDVPVGLCCFDRDLRYFHINEFLARINGVPVEEHYGRTIGEVIPDVAARVEADLHRVLDTAVPVIDGMIEVEVLSERHWARDQAAYLGEIVRACEAHV